MGLINAFSSSQQALTNLISTDLLGALGLDTSIQDEIRNSAQQLLGGWAMEIRSQLLRGSSNNSATNNRTLETNASHTSHLIRTVNIQLSGATITMAPQMALETHRRISKARKRPTLLTLY